MKHAILYFSLVCFVMLSGCASISARKYRPLADSPNEPHPYGFRNAFYPGLPLDFQAIGKKRDPYDFTPIPGCAFAAMGIIDIPLSLVADTVCLPYDIYRTIRGPKKNELKAANQAAQTIGSEASPQSGR